MKDTLIIHTSYAKKFAKLNKAQFGELMLAAIEYQESGNVPEFEDILVSMAFDSVKYDIDKNNEKYEEACEKRREAGKKGGLAKASKASNAKQEVAEVANASNAKQCQANVAKASDNDNDNDNDNDVCINTNNKKRERKERKSNDFSPPTREDVMSFCVTNKIKIDTARFYDHYQSQGWVKSNGRPVKDWKACVRAWASREQDYPRTDKSVVEKIIEFEAAKGG